MKDENCVAPTPVCMNNFCVACNADKDCENNENNKKCKFVKNTKLLRHNWKMRAVH